MYGEEVAYIDDEKRLAEWASVLWVINGIACT